MPGQEDYNLVPVKKVTAMIPVIPGILFKTEVREAPSTIKENITRGIMKEELLSNVVFEH
jgi:hypothetical protein